MHAEVRSALRYFCTQRDKMLSFPLTPQPVYLVIARELQPLFLGSSCRCWQSSGTFALIWHFSHFALATVLAKLVKLIPHYVI